MVSCYRDTAVVTSGCPLTQLFPAYDCQEAAARNASQDFLSDSHLFSQAV